ncbi:MAG: sigma-70 family RNA polymerase sigma factor [Verrucomicrobiae bacterium]|nr:sigma-70 family RNA polymerase sigma factor [Verrucomicrobiae bacterium]
MRDSAPSDAELLAAWTNQCNEPAFHALVSRYAGLVHMAAKRISGDHTLAAEATQLTFILLARKAKSLGGRHSLAGWLHLTAVMQARNLVRQSRRERHKREILAMETGNHSQDDSWRNLQPVLDDALAALSDKDREALLLRFYRSFSVREVAAALGIGTDAAQKRIDRATERLRGKLARRGLQAGGALSTTLLAGFAADAQAATPAISLLASKAIAAGTAGTGGLAGLLALAAAMKTSSLIPPAIALIVTVGWVGTQRRSIARLEHETSALREQIRAADLLAVSTADRTAVPRPTSDDSRIDWQGFVRRFTEMKSQGRLRSEEMGWVRDIERRLQEMTREQLLAEWETVTDLDVPVDLREITEDMVMSPLMKKDPEVALTRFMEHRTSDTDNWWEPNDALKSWATAEPGRAAAWMDAQVAAGRFSTTALDGKDQLRILFEKTLIGVLFPTDPDAAARRLELLPANQRGDVLRGQTINAENQAAFAMMVRRSAPESEQITILAQLAFQSVSKDGYASATPCLDRIEATPAERTACIESVAVSQFQNLARQDGITAKDVDDLREWADSVCPEATDSLTGKALGNALLGGGRQTKFAELADLAVRYGESSGSDEVLVGFLNNPAIGLMVAMKQARREEIHSLVRKIDDEARRAEILDLMEKVIPKP